MSTSPAVVPPEATSTHKRGLRILLAEDDERLQEALLGVLKSTGHEVELFSEGRSAQEAIMLKDFDLVISDIRMPLSRVSGIDLLVYIKKHKPLPVILMTGFSAVSDVEMADRKGADGFLSKPFFKEDLIAEIRKIFPEEPIAPVALDLDFEYSKLSIEDFLYGRSVQFDVFVRITKEKYVMVAHKGENIPEDRISTYKNKGLRFLYLRKADFQSYLEFNLTLSRAVRGNQKVSPEKRASLLRHTAEVFLEQIFNEEIDKEAFETARIVAENGVDFLSQYSDTLDLLSALNGHSDILYAHSLGVSMYAAMIARELKWNSVVSLMRLSVIGLMHDIGKKEIPREILDKPENSLTPEEIALIETHPQRGAAILARTGVPDDIVQAVYQHHENCIGTGYPSRYRKNKIIPTARLISVADEFCELTIRGKGRTPMAPATALAQMKILFGDGLDSQFVEALTSALKLKSQANA
jgi:putative nucleotidyltransferase with HDIG domain